MKIYSVRLYLIISSTRAANLLCSFGYIDILKGTVVGGGAAVVVVVVQLPRPIFDHNVFWASDYI